MEKTDTYGNIYKTKYVKKNIPSYYELTKKISRYNNILNDETFNYLEKLLHLEKSVLYNDNFSFNELSELDVFNSLVLYNIYNNLLKYFDLSCKEYKLFGNDYNYLGINMFSNEIVRLNYNDDVPIVNFYKGEKVKNFDDRKKDILELIEKYYSLLNIEYINKQKYYSKYYFIKSSTQLSYIEYRIEFFLSNIERLNRITDDQIKKDVELDNIISEQKSRLLDSFLEDNNLKFNDFNNAKLIEEIPRPYISHNYCFMDKYSEEDNVCNALEKDYGFAKILIK